LDPGQQQYDRESGDGDTDRWGQRFGEACIGPRRGLRLDDNPVNRGDDGHCFLRGAADDPGGVEVLQYDRRSLFGDFLSA